MAMPSSYPSPALSYAAQQLFESPPLMNASTADPTILIASQSGSTYDYADRFDVRRKFWPGPDERSFTDPDRSHLNIKKRIILCCDGTWQDGTSAKKHWQCTNIWKISNAVNRVDTRCSPPVLQVVYYQSGIGTEASTATNVYTGATGATLDDKVQEAYCFIAQNFNPGDEIFLFGFSRGAYTVRVIAEVIGYIGILDRSSMEHFAAIFKALQKREKRISGKERERIESKLAPWTHSDSLGKKRAGADTKTFTVKCIGVFDTVRGYGVHEQVPFLSKYGRELYGFPKLHLGGHVEKTFQALALNETRSAFNCDLFVQTEEGKRKNQVLKQCWFPGGFFSCPCDYTYLTEVRDSVNQGSHSDIGGSYEWHDLSDLTLSWMVANVENMLCLDTAYITSTVRANSPWGALTPHNSRTGLFTLLRVADRLTPTDRNVMTNELLHESVLHQSNLSQRVRVALIQHPELIAPLLPFEEQIRVNWPLRAESTLEPGGEKETRQDLDLIAKRWWNSLGKNLLRTNRMDKFPQTAMMDGVPAITHRITMK